MADVASNMAAGASLGGTIGSVVPGIGTAIGAGVGALGGAALGGIQYLQAKKRAKEDEANRPMFEIPAEIYQNLNQAQQQALQGLPEAQKQQFLSNLQRGTAYGLSQLGSRRAGLVGVAELNEQQNQGYQNLLSADSAARMANQDKLRMARNNLADYKVQGFGLNKLNPYNEGIARRENYSGALYQNLNNSMWLAGSAAGLMGGLKSTTPQSPSMDLGSSIPTMQMSPNQFQSQGATPNPYSAQQTFAPNVNYNSGFNWSGGMNG